MSSDNVTSIEQLTERLTRLEEFCTFMQRTVNDLDQVVLAQQLRIESLETRLLQLVTQLDRVSQSTDIPLSAQDEKPPHY